MSLAEHAELRGDGEFRQNGRNYQNEMNGMNGPSTSSASSRQAGSGSTLHFEGAAQSLHEMQIQAACPWGEYEMGS